MPHVPIVHSMEDRYAKPVGLMGHRLLARPRDILDLRRHELRIVFTPGLPGAGCVGYDPSNGLVIGRNLIRIGVARSPGQAVPLAGGFPGDPAEALELSVDVAVQAVPDEPLTEAA